MPSTTRLPAPPIKFSPDRSDPSYQEDCERWRASLTDSDVRALAYEYKVGARDETSIDAWAEYEYRFGDRAKGPRQEFTQKSRQRAPKESRRRKVKGD